MRTIAAETKVYTFNELTEEQKRLALDKNRDYEVQDSFWSEYIIDHWKEKLEQIGFLNAKIYWSGFCSQGDGAGFEADIDLQTVLANLAMCSPWQDARWLLAGEIATFNGLISVSPIKHRGHYYHEGCYSFDWYSDYTQECPAGNNIINTCFDGIEELRRDICQQIYKDLENEYEYLTSDEYLSQWFSDGDFEFTEDGEIYY